MLGINAFFGIFPGDAVALHQPTHPVFPGSENCYGAVAQLCQFAFEKADGVDGGMSLVGGKQPKNFRFYRSMGDAIEIFQRLRVRKRKLSNTCKTVVFPQPEPPVIPMIIGFPPR